MPWLSLYVCLTVILSNCVQKTLEREDFLPFRVSQKEKPEPRAILYLSLSLCLAIWFLHDLGLIMPLMERERGQFLFRRRDDSIFQGALFFFKYFTNSYSVCGNRLIQHSIACYQYCVGQTFFLNIYITDVINENSKERSASTRAAPCLYPPPGI